MYEYQEKALAAAQCSSLNGVGGRTVGENIDAKIIWHRQQIEQLERSKDTLKPLLGMRIEDLRQAMQY